MSNNNDSSLLLEWVNHELINKGSPARLYNFSQLASTPFLYELLLSIDQDHFLPLNHLTFDFTPYLLSLENYLLEV